MRKIFVLLGIINLIFCQTGNLGSIGISSNLGSISIIRPDGSGGVVVKPEDGKYGSLRVYGNSGGQGGQGGSNQADNGQYLSLKISAGNIVDPTPAPSAKQCPKVYTGCNYTGSVIEICDKVPHFDINTIHSVYIPAGGWITLYGDNAYAGKSVTFRESQACVDKITFSFLHSKMSSHKKHHKNE